MQKELDSEIAKNIEEIKQMKNNYAIALKACRKSINENNILGAEDKNLSVANTILGYFNRHRISTIKEGINLYLQEERLDQMEREARIARWNQERVLKEMQEEQEYHNEQIQKIARENQEKIDKALDEIKYGS